MRTILAVGFGGFFGSICRYLLSLLPLPNHSGFPYLTLLINVLGALLAGILVGLAERFTLVHPDWFSLLKVGFCGGFTTFSTFALESSTLLSTGKGWMAALYIALSIFLGVAAIFLGKSIVS